MSNWGPVLYLAGLLRPILAGIDAFVHDWGLAVILLTIAVRLLLFPLSVRNARFTRKNRVFNQALKELRATFKNDPDKLQAETMKLAKEHKFNPFSMLGNAVVQMPILAAVYAVFYHFGSDITSSLFPWVTALGATDPLHILPALAAAASAGGILVPMIEPEAVSGAVSKYSMIAIMLPVMLFMLWKAPVAIALYMGTSSFWGMGERRFLRTKYAVRTFKLAGNTAQQEEISKA